jgi:hypothetical protein
VSEKAPLTEKIRGVLPRKVFAASFTVVFYGHGNVCCKAMQFCGTSCKPDLTGAALKSAQRNTVKTCAKIR